MLAPLVSRGGATGRGPAPRSRGISSGPGQYACYQLAINNGSSSSSAAAVCGGSETPRDACYRTCSANGTSTSSRTAICGS